MGWSEMTTLMWGDLGQKFSCGGSTFLKGEAWGCPAAHHRESGLIVDNSIRGSSHPCLRTCISHISSDGKLPVSAGEIGKGLNVNALHKSFRCNDQLHRPVDAAVMRPIAGSSPGHHVLIECIINAYGERVGTSPTKQMSDVKHERGVALPHMLPSQFPVYPDCGCMEYRLKLDPYRGVFPLARNIEGAPIPGDTTIIN